MRRRREESRTKHLLRLRPSVQVLPCPSGQVQIVNEESRPIREGDSNGIPPLGVQKHVPKAVAGRVAGHVETRRRSSFRENGNSPRGGEGRIPILLSAHRRRTLLGEGKGAMEEVFPSRLLREEGGGRESKTGETGLLDSTNVTVADDGPKVLQSGPKRSNIEGTQGEKGGDRRARNSGLANPPRAGKTLRRSERGSSKSEKEQRDCRPERRQHTTPRRRPSKRARGVTSMAAHHEALRDATPFISIISTADHTRGILLVQSRHRSVVEKVEGVASDRPEGRHETQSSSTRARNHESSDSNERSRPPRKHEKEAVEKKELARRRKRRRRRQRRRRGPNECDPLTRTSALELPKEKKKGEAGNGIEQPSQRTTPPAREEAREDADANASSPNPAKRKTQVQ